MEDSKMEITQRTKVPTIIILAILVAALAVAAYLFQQVKHEQVVLEKNVQIAQLANELEGYASSASAKKSIVQCLPAKEVEYYVDDVGGYRLAIPEGWSVASKTEEDRGVRYHSISLSLDNDERNIILDIGIVPTDSSYQLAYQSGAPGGTLVQEEGDEFPASVSVMGTEVPVSYLEYEGVKNVAYYPKGEPAMVGSGYVFQAVLSIDASFDLQQVIVPGFEGAEYNALWLSSLILQTIEPL